MNTPLASPFSNLRLNVNLNKKERETDSNPEKRPAASKSRKTNLFYTKTEKITRKPFRNGNCLI